MKIRKTQRVYLTVEVEEPWKDQDGSRWASLGRTKASELARLIGASNIGYLDQVDYHIDRVDTCSLCGREWEEDADGPMCCDAAVAEWAANKCDRIIK